MNAIPPTHLAVRHTRMLLVTAGLHEDEADRFMERLTKELTSGALKSEDQRHLFIERE